MGAPETVVSAAKVFMESLCGNAIARVASAIMPRAVVTSPILRTLTRPDIVGWRMRHSVVVVRHVLVGGTIVRLVDVWPVLNRAVLGRARNLVLGPRRRAVIRMLLRSLVVVIAGVVALMLLRTAVVVVGHAHAVHRRERSLREQVRTDVPTIAAIFMLWVLRCLEKSRACENEGRSYLSRRTE